MTDHLRRIALHVDEPDPDHYYWILTESRDDASVWTDVEVSDTSFTSWIAAWDAGTMAILKHASDTRRGPRAAGESEDTDPLG